MKAFMLILCAAIGYLLGSANSSLIVGRFYGVDVRKHGSGNAGTTNVLRTLGKKAAFFVMLGDILKGVLACLAGLMITGDTGLMLGGFTAVLGHNWPLYFGFKGGKGVLTSATVIFMMDWRLGLILIAAFAVIVALFRYVSLGSIVSAAVFPLISIVFNKGLVFIVFAVCIALLVIVRHRSNIKRIVAGSESKLGEKKVKI